MNEQITERIISFYGDLFDFIFSQPFRNRIKDPLRRKAVVRHVEEAADSASQSLTRFFLNQRSKPEDVANIADACLRLLRSLSLEDIANTNVLPETVTAKVLANPADRDAARTVETSTEARVALHSVVQLLLRLGPVMAEWQKLNFSSTFELPRRVVNRLNEISQQMDALGISGQAAADERYELTYRDHLVDRFHRVEAGTVRMTTSMDVDLRELFVMPKLVPRASTEGAGGKPDASELMTLSTARAFFSEPSEAEPRERKAGSALEQVKTHPRNVIIGAPGNGKSTFLEWLQVKVAAVEESFPIGGQQAIPLLLRVRQLDPRRLPDGPGLVASAMASNDRAALMPSGWIARQMAAGRVLFMLDGLDETEPELRDQLLLPWLVQLCNQYPSCRFVVSSRPVGYPAGTLDALKFAECDLLDFDADQIQEYTRHWCTAVRLARNEPEEEGRREGVADGQRIAASFKSHPYISNLARNPLMLSAICLVNDFEKGELPRDRALLYKLCVEGLLHNWDARRGIRSEFGFEEKLRACGEVALAMQTEDRAEYGTAEVQAVFSAVFQDAGRAGKLLEHIRYRTGLLLERRPGVFAFAHLTFQEYLAARAILEGNRMSVDTDQMVREHDDGRWQEVIALYCGMAPALNSRRLVEELISQSDTDSLATVLAEAYLSSRSELAEDGDLRRAVIRRIGVAPSDGWRTQLIRFPESEVALLANTCVGKSSSSLSGSYKWLRSNPQHIDASALLERLTEWRQMSPVQATELVHLLHAHAPDTIIATIAADIGDVYSAQGPTFSDREKYGTLAEVALIGLEARGREPVPGGVGVVAALVRVLSALAASGSQQSFVFSSGFMDGIAAPRGRPTAKECAELVRQVAARLKVQEYVDEMISRAEIAELSTSEEPPRGKQSRRKK